MMVKIMTISFLVFVFGLALLVGIVRYQRKLKKEKVRQYL